MKENNRPKWKQNAFYYFATIYKDKPTTEEELRQINMTEAYQKEQEYVIKNGETWKCQINAKVRLGKSTLGFAEGKRLIELMKKHNQIKKKIHFGLNNIARDQSEKMEKLRDPETEYTVIVTDEENALEDTGENITIERAEQQMISDVQAARYIHEINISPKGIQDPNTDILLDIISTDKETLQTKCNLSYIWHEGGEDHIQLLGHVILDVGTVNKNWEKNVKKHFYKPKYRKKKRDNNIVEKERKKDWYVEYAIKKHEKMELLTKHGVTKPRVLKYSKAIIKTIERLKGLTKIEGALNKDIIRNIVKQEFRALKMPQSIIGEELSAREVNGVLSQYQVYHKLNNTKNKYEKRARTSGSEIEILRVKEIEEQIETIMKGIIEQEKELRLYKELYDKYSEKL